MEKPEYKFEKFEGPLELLLYLISKHKLNIYDIEISSLLQQYMDYINEMQAADLEVSSEFLEMAARLVYIKSVSLLPRPDEVTELRKELTGQLLEFRNILFVARQLEKMYRGNLIFVRKPAALDLDMSYALTHQSEELLSAYIMGVGKGKRKIPPDPEAFSGIVKRKMVSVTSKIVFVLRKLYQNGRVKYSDFFQTNERSEMVATFLAVLELVKSNRIYMTDDNQYICFNNENLN